MLWRLLDDLFGSVHWGLRECVQGRLFRLQRRVYELFWVHGMRWWMQYWVFGLFRLLRLRLHLFWQLLHLVRGRVRFQLCQDCRRLLLRVCRHMFRQLRHRMLEILLHDLLDELFWGLRRPVFRHGDGSHRIV